MLPPAPNKSLITNSSLLLLSLLLLYFKSLVHTIRRLIQC
nr:MAG TPA_asm: hypothetical protein [Caudoviricetes sp.]